MNCQLSPVIQLVECYTGDQRVSSSRLSAGSHCVVSLSLVLVQPRKTGKRPDMTEKLLTGM